MNHKWREPIRIREASLRNWGSVFDAYKKGMPRPKEYLTESEFGADIETLYLMHRWARSPKLTCHVSSRMIRVLMSTAFDDLQVKDIYLPDKVDCFQLVVEQDDPIVSENVIFFRPEELGLEDLAGARPTTFRLQYFVAVGSGSHVQGIMNVNPSQIIGDIAEMFSDPAAYPVNPRYLAVIAAVGFLADSDHQTFYRHCVLKKDEVKYQAAVASGNQQAMRLLEERAVRRGKNERVFDTFSVEIGESEPQATSGESFQGGGKRPHLRRGHFRAIRHGEGRRKVRMQWIPPVVVRSDLLAKD